MRYALLICGDEKVYEAMTPDESAAHLAKYGEFMEDLGSTGVLQGGERLRPVADATTVRVRDGEVLTSDGPFAETKEQVGGFCLIECASMDEAVEVAAQHPAASYGTIEVRELFPPL